jgi:hypothetical protein
MIESVLLTDEKGQAQADKLMPAPVDSNTLIFMLPSLPGSCNGVGGDDCSRGRAGILSILHAA